MAFLPFLCDRYRRINDEVEQNLYNEMIVPRVGGDAQEDPVSSPNTFRVRLDVKHFGPNDVTVRVGNGFVVVEGRHSEKRDRQGWVARRFTRRYPLPEGCSEESVRCRLSSDGVLTIIASTDAPRANERQVPVTRSGPIRTQ